MFLLPLVGVLFFLFEVDVDEDDDDDGVELAAPITEGCIMVGVVPELFSIPRVRLVSVVITDVLMGDDRSLAGNDPEDMDLPWGESTSKRPLLLLPPLDDGGVCIMTPSLCMLICNENELVDIGVAVAVTVGDNFDMDGTMVSSLLSTDDVDVVDESIALLLMIIAVGVLLPSSFIHIT